MKANRIKIMGKYFLIMVILSLVPAPVMCSENTLIYGHGNSSCGGWLSAREQRGSVASTYEAWALGFVTSTGYFYDLKETDAPAIFSHIDNFCNNNPLESIKSATINVSTALRKIYANTGKTFFGDLLRSEGLFGVCEK